MLGLVSQKGRLGRRDRGRASRRQRGGRRPCDQGATTPATDAVTFEADANPASNGPHSVDGSARPALRDRSCEPPAHRGTRRSSLAFAESATADRHDALNRPPRAGTRSLTARRCRPIAIPVTAQRLNTRRKRWLRLPGSAPRPIKRIPGLGTPGLLGAKRISQTGDVRMRTIRREASVGGWTTA